MFPLHEDTIALLAVAAVLAGMGVFTAVRGWLGWFWTMFIFLVGVVWPWPIVAYLGFHHLTISAGLFFGAWTVGALLGGLLWGLVARRIAASTLMIVVALLPSVSWVAYLLERQRVPNAACATEAVFLVGDLQLRVPRSVGISAAPTDSGRPHVWHGAYDEWPGAKPQVRSLCRVIARGQSPVDLGHARISVSAYRSGWKETCPQEAGAEDQSPICEAFERTTLNVLQLYARADGEAVPSMGQFNSDAIREARAEGQRDGHRCNDSTLGPKTRYCTVWHQLTPEVLMVASVKLGPFEEGEDPLGDTILLVQEIIGQLRDG